MLCDITGNAAVALQYFQKAVSVFPKSAEANYNLGTFLLRRGQPAEAEPYLQKATQGSFSSVEPHFNLANAYLRQGKLDEAMEEYARTLELNLWMGKAHNNLGICLFHKGRWVEALAHYQEAARLMPGDPDPLLNMGKVYFSDRTTRPGKRKLGVRSENAAQFGTSQDAARFSEEKRARRAGTLALDERDQPNQTGKMAGAVVSSHAGTLFSWIEVRIFELRLHQSG